MEFQQKDEALSWLNNERVQLVAKAQRAIQNLKDLPDLGALKNRIDSLLDAESLVDALDAFYKKYSPLLKAERTGFYKQSAQFAEVVEQHKDLLKDPPRKSA